MASTRVESQFLWSSAATKSLNTNSWFVSDELLLNAEDWQALAQFRADNSGTPGSGDTVEVRFLYTTGDLDNASGSNDYPDVNTSGSTISRADFAALLDTYNNYDPDGTTAAVKTAAKGVRLAVRAAQGATRAITFAARLITHRPQ